MTASSQSPETATVVRELVDNHRAFLGFLERRLGSRELAEDILQDAFVRGLAKVETLRDAESARAWFYRLLRNAVIDHYRKNASTQAALERLMNELAEPDRPAPEVEAAVCQCIGRLAQTLKPEYATAVRRIELEDASIAELAAEAGITTGNAAVRIHRAREALRRQVLASCGTCAEHGCLDCSCKA